MRARVRNVQVDRRIAADLGTGTRNRVHRLAGCGQWVNIPLVLQYPAGLSYNADGDTNRLTASATTGRRARR